MPGTISPERVSNWRVTAPGQSLSRISTEKDTKKIAGKKENPTFIISLIRSKKPEAGSKKAGHGFCSAVVPLLVPIPAPHFRLLTPDKLISCGIFPLLGPVRPGVTARVKNHS
jgi:hypothetical protein